MQRSPLPGRGAVLRPAPHPHPAPQHRPLLPAAVLGGELGRAGDKAADRAHGGQLLGTKSQF